MSSAWTGARTSSADGATPLPHLRGASMPEWVAVTILGIIEGITEFLPVSSTGHLLLAENTHLLPQQSEVFNVVIQAGAVVAVFLVFSGRVKDLLLNWSDREARDYLYKL